MATIAFGCAPSASGCGPTGSDAHVGARTRPTTAVAGGADAATAAPAESARALRAQAKHKPRKSPQPLPTDPVLEGVRCAAFVPFLPPTFEGYRAKSVAEGKDIDLGEGAGLALLKRGYFKSSTALDLEIVDTAQSKPLRTLFERTRALEHDGEAAVIKPIRVQGHAALAQWNSTAKATRVTVLVAERYLVHVTLRPSEGLAGAIELASKLDLAGLAELERSDKLAAQH